MDIKNIKKEWNATILDILKAFIEICNKYHLRYYCCAGTAIGAARHHGMIPWDDDIDVLMPRPDYDRFMHAFGHVFAGGYAAGYYSYKWAEVLSADAYEAFEEAARLEGRGIVDAETGARYRREILSVGGSRQAMASFAAFRGRPPRIDALLRHHGMDGGIDGVAGAEQTAH